MKFNKPVEISTIASLIKASVIGDENAMALGINEIHKVEPGDICFVDHPKYYSKSLASKATFIIINSKEVIKPEGKTLLYTEEPFEAYLKIVDHFRPFTTTDKMINDEAQIGKGTIVMPNVFIGKAVTIGDNCIIYPNVIIMDYTEIGNNVIIQSGTVIGSEAFYYNTKKNREVWYKKMKSCGNVIIEDDVEIGACCTIDRGVTASTRIGKGTKMDNMVHIGHDNEIGKNCLIAAQVGVAGATVLEEGVILWGQVGVSKTLTIGANAVVYAKSGIAASIEGGKSYFGIPAQEATIRKKEIIWTQRIPELWEKVRKLTMLKNNQE